MRITIPIALFAAYLVLFAALAIEPYSREVWLAENIPIMGIAAILVILYARGIRFSALSYVLMSVLVFLHTIGGYYTFERVPFDWFTDTFGFERNNYDRIAHFSVGFYAYPIAELLYTRGITANRALLFLFPVFAIVAAAALYEIIEWLFAVSSDAAAGTAFLGSQGDMWDAQKDMLADSLGAILAGGLYMVKRTYGRTS